jgi:hypothetical protein
MHITYATAHKWIKPITNDPMGAFGKKTKGRMRSTLKNISEYDIKTEVKELGDDFLNWFLPMYEERIYEKEHPVVFDIREKTLGKKKTYYSFALYEDGEPLGGTIFSTPKNRFSIAYRTYKNSWTNAELQANPSLYTEYAICKYAYEKGKEVLVHGRDRNPYGMNSNIGLAAFKLAAGCQPVKSVTYDIKQLDTETLECDTLVLEYPGEDVKEITKAHLFVTHETEQNYVRVTKYPERLSVTTHYRD